jgi:hypothetical protein
MLCVIDTQILSEREIYCRVSFSMLVGGRWRGGVGVGGRGGGTESCSLSPQTLYIRTGSTN